MLRALERLGIETPVLQIITPQEPTPPFAFPGSPGFPIEAPELPQQLDPSFGQSQFWGFGNVDLPDGVEITPELFETVSSLEPLSVRVGALDEQMG